MTAATFKILTGASLKTAIAGYGKTASTFAEKTHQVAYSALHHVEQHHDAIYCNALYAATPKNYRLAVVKWMTAFGKVTFDAKAMTFTYAKGKKSDMAAALAVSPAEYEKAGRAGENKPAKTLLEKLESMMQGVLDADDATQQDRDVASAVNRVLTSFRKSMPKAAPASNVVPIKAEGEQADKPKAAPKAKAPKVAKAAKPAAAPKADRKESAGGMMSAKEAAAEQRARLAATAAESVAA